MSGSRGVLLALALLFAGVARAQMWGRGSMPEVEGSFRLEPNPTVVGTPCHFVLSLKSEGRLDVQEISGLLRDGAGVEYLAQGFEPYADGTYRLPVRFTEPASNTLHVTVAGMQTVEKNKRASLMGNVYSSYSVNFQKRMAPLRLDVRPLPEAGRPAAFSGAVGERFLMKQTLTPDRVRPNDLVTATYELRYQGYCPSNVWPAVERLSPDFKAYEPREVSREPGKVTWTQVLVPRTTQATNSALVSLCYYNPRTRRYEYARGTPKPLVFVSDKAAADANTSVLVDDSAAAGRANDASAPLVLRFGPSDGSPAIATLPAGTPVEELSRVGAWRRLRTARAIGWSR